MAQPVYEEHPLQQYLRDSGVERERDIMPGSISDFTNPETDADREPNTTTTTDDLIRFLRHTLPSLLLPLLLPNSQRRRRRKSIAFTERFKYDVISSSLLSLTLTPPVSSAPLHHIPSGHEPKRSARRHDPQRWDGWRWWRARYPWLAADSDSDSNSCPDSIIYYYLAAVVVTIAVTAGAGYHILAVVLAALVLVATLFFSYDIPDWPGDFNYDKEEEEPMPPTLQALHDLISAGNAWDAVVHEAITVLEADGPVRSTFPSPLAFPTTPSSAPAISTPTTPPTSSSSTSSPSTSASIQIRTALHSTLHTTHTQCDTLRTLLAALAQPGEEVGRLAGMYAPPSPSLSTHSFSSSFSSSPSHQRSPSKSKSSVHFPFPHSPSHPPPRPLSLPTRSRRSMLSPSEASSAVSRTPDVLEGKRATWNGSYSALAKAAAGAGAGDGENKTDADEVDGNTSFGTAALNLHRKRKSDGLGIFGLSSFSVPHTPLHHHTTTTRPFSTSTSSTFTSASRFTTRNPLGGVRHHHNHHHESLRGALAARRYACAHLLALRFGDEEGEGEEVSYWEDVRSVMDLLTSTLGDAASRLAAALRDAEETRQREVEGDELGHQGGDPLEVRDMGVDSLARKEWQSMVQMLMRMRPASSSAFAPMPSHIARFAAHVDVISSAMNDAGDNLERCVMLLRGEGPAEGAGTGESTQMHRSAGHEALAAYERLRRELGLALRECERGRERLLDCIAAANPPAPDEGDGDEEDLPGLGHDAGSEESDRHDSPMLDFDAGGAEGEDLAVVVSGDDNNADEVLDDATAHLLRMASSRHLPPQGIEQVFEAEPEPVVAFTRERSKLTREERIRAMKARRESSGHGLLPDDPLSKSKPTRETWGPGVDVVQELKDVIWQVGERRRKMAEGSL